MASMSILETKGLTKTFGGLSANTNIDFSLTRGKITALIGPNGAGKSTFVGMLSGRITATAGSVHFDGVDISNLPAFKRIGMGIAYTFQITSIFPGLTVQRNVELAARRALSLPKSEILDAVDEVLHRVDLLDRKDQKAADLSYGHQRILEIATQGLADAEVEQFIELINSLAGKSTILLIEHNMDVVMRAADHIAVLNYGELLAEGTPKEIQENKEVQNAYLGKTIDA